MAQCQAAPPARNPETLSQIVLNCAFMNSGVPQPQVESGLTCTGHLWMRIRPRLCSPSLQPPGTLSSSNSHLCSRAGSFFYVCAAPAATLSPAVNPPHSLTHILSLTLSHTHQTHTHTESEVVSLSLTHTHTHTHTECSGLTYIIHLYYRQIVQWELRLSWLPCETHHPHVIPDSFGT